MNKAAAIGIALVVIVAQLCCAPPLEASLPDPVVLCPVTQQPCHAAERDECEGEAPLLASPVTHPLAVAPELVAIAAIAVDPLPRIAPTDAVTHWAMPTRTIQLRI